MASRHSRGPWHAVIRKTRAGHRVLEVHNTKGTIAVVYTDESDTRVLAASKKLLATLKCMVRAFAHDGDRTEAQAAALTKAQKLLAELAA